MGKTLLDYALEWHNFEMIKYLISIGVSPINPLDIRMSVMAEKTVLDSFKPLLAYQTLTKVFSNSDCHEDEDLRTTPPKCTCRVCIFNLELYRALLPYQCHLHQSTSLESRLHSAKHAMPCGGSIKVVRFLLQPERNTDPKAVCIPT
ncbi:hypothetical protein GGR53DRAFT_13348 [Hypoxylon sp. FL1150]|nr:hypothetical protein GGR53DRAFT_13348 [Hypoxylon sp. FL1150]